VWKALTEVSPWNSSWHLNFFLQFPNQQVIFWATLNKKYLLSENHDSSKTCFSRSIWFQKENWNWKMCSHGHHTQRKKAAVRAPAGCRFSSLRTDNCHCIFQFQTLIILNLFFSIAEEYYKGCCWGRWHSNW